MNLACPLCQQPLAVPELYAGQVMKCARCQGTFTVPEVPGTKPPEAQPVAAPPADPPAPTPTVSAPAPAPTPAPAPAPPPLEIDLDLSDKPADWAHNDWEWLRKKIEDRTRNAALDVEHEAARAAWFDKETARLARKGEAVPGEMSEQWFRDHPMPGYSKGEGGWRRFLSDEEVEQRDDLIDRTGKAWYRQRREREEASGGRPLSPEDVALLEKLKAWGASGADPDTDPSMAEAPGRANYLKVLAGLLEENKTSDPALLVVRCPSCGTPNRVPENVQAFQPMVCGNCKKTFNVPPREGEALPPPAVPEQQAATGEGQVTPPTAPAQDMGTGEKEATPVPYRGAKTVLAGKGDIDLGPSQEEIDRAIGTSIGKLRARAEKLSPQVEKARAARMARNRSRRGAAQRRVAGRLGLGGIYQAIDFGQDVLTAFGRNDEGTSDPEREMLAELKAIAEKLDVLASIQSGDGASLAERNVGESDDRQPAAGGKPNAASSPTARAARALNDPTLSLLARAFQGPAQRPSQQAGPAQPGGGRNNWIGELLRFLGM